MVLKEEAVSSMISWSRILDNSLKHTIDAATSREIKCGLASDNIRAEMISYAQSMYDQYSGMDEVMFIGDWVKLSPSRFVDKYSKHLDPTELDKDRLVINITKWRNKIIKIYEKLFKALRVANCTSSTVSEQIEDKMMQFLLDHVYDMSYDNEAVSSLIRDWVCDRLPAREILGTYSTFMRK